MINLFEIINIKKYEYNILLIIYDYLKEIKRGDLYNERDEYIQNYGDNFWNTIFDKMWLSEEFVDEFIDKIGIDNICKYISLTPEFIDKYSDEINWDIFCDHKLLFQSII